MSQLEPSQEGEGCVNTQTGSVSVADSQSNIVMCPSASEKKNVSKNECAKNECAKSVYENVNSEGSDVSEVSDHVDIQNTTKKNVNSKSGGDSISRFADFLQPGSGHTRKANFKINKTEKGKFNIAKGSPLSTKKNEKSSQRSHCFNYSGIFNQLEGCKRWALYPTKTSY